MYFLVMETRYYPDKESVDTAMRNDDPLLMLVSFDSSVMLLANIDDSLEHHILLKQCGFAEADLDKFFRIVLNRQGADWTFVCPARYRNIADRNRRIEAFNNDGIDIISRAVKQAGYDVKINIPQRYRRHFGTLSE